MERYHPVVSIMLSYMNLKKAFSENLSCREVKIDKNFWGDLPNLIKIRLDISVSLQFN